jgi:N-methylhydantoinase A
VDTGVDVGGTFTDVVAWDGTTLRTAKVPSTPDQSEGVAEGIGTATSGRAGRLLHGTTVATNAVLEGKVARTVLVTDAGFQDLIEIGRQDRPSLYDLHRARPEPIASRALRVGSPGRGDRYGTRIGDVEDPGGVADAVAALDPEAVAVALLYSFVDSAAEEALAEAIRRRLGETPVSVSSEVVAEFREYERTSTTLLNAALVPAVSRYLGSLRRRAESVGVEGSIEVMRSSGGLIGLAEAARIPASILLSGPAGGVVAASALGDALGHRRVVSFDMGGTSTDVCRIEDGRPGVTYERSIEGHPCRMPSVAIHTVGAGGGSIGWVDGGGALRVGPHSAGAVPGPVCYGRGGIEPAVTDANLVVGRIGRDARFGGSVRLNGRAADRALSRLGAAIGFSAEDAALGMIEVVEAHMERAVRAVSIEEGADPRSAVLVAFGGAGGLHAVSLAKRLAMAGVVIPAHAGVFSALGLLLAPPRADEARSVLARHGELGELEATADAVGREARRRVGRSAAVSLLVDVRYLGQSHETQIPYRIGESWEILAGRFHDVHRRRNGFERRGDPIEIVTVRAEGTAPPAMAWADVPASLPEGEPRRGDRAVLLGGREVRASVWWRPALAPGREVVGPAVIEEADATTLLEPGDRARVHDSGALEVSW